MINRLIGCCFIALCWLGIFTAQVSAASLTQGESTPTVSSVADEVLPAEPPATNECATVTLIPVSECDALLDLYRTANGAQWENRTHWLDTNEGVTPCDWFGVVCQNGHVTQLNLASNQLAGRLSRFLVFLPELQSLDLADNLLEAPVPGSICLLAERGVSGHFDYNLLDVQNRKIRQCLTQMQSGWQLTQTIPPKHTEIAEVGTTAITLTWQAIPYQTDGGYYEIGYTSSLTQPYTLHGTTQDKSATGYTLDHLTPGQAYYIRVRTVTPAHTKQENDLKSDSLFFTAVTGSSEKVLLLVYFPADNDLSPYAPGVMARLKAGTKLNPNAVVYYLVDRRGDHNTDLYVIANNVVTKTNAITQTWGTDELDTMDPAVLSWFLREGRKRVSASRVIVSLMGHGAGLSPEFNWLVPTAPEEPLKPQPGIPPLPRDHPPTPGDENDLSGFLSPIDYGHALDEATNNGADPFDVVFFDHCFAGNLDELYQVRNTAHAYVVSPNYAWLAASYRAYLTQFEPTATPEQLARRIISIYSAVLNPEHPNVIYWISNDEISTVASQVSALGVALSKALDQGDETLIRNATMNSKFIDTNQCGDANLVLAPPDEMVGASSFANNLRRTFGTGTPVHIAALALFNSLSVIESRVITGTPYIAPDTEWDYNNTITILAPLERNTPRNVAWRASVYTTTTPLIATWSPVPTQTVQISESLDFVQDGQWDDFLNQWYTAPPAPTVGEWCSYTPPTIVTDTVVETLSLVVTSSDGVSLTAASTGLQISWSASEEDEVSDYQLFIRNDNYPNWTLLSEFGLDSTSFSFDLPETSSDTEFQIFGQDELGNILSTSNIAVVPAPPAEPVKEIFLPLIQHE
ncbi:MAG: clostripain-related cysteine peptidase [Caldilineaceae bacterium]